MFDVVLGSEASSFFGLCGVESAYIQTFIEVELLTLHHPKRRAYFAPRNLESCLMSSARVALPDYEVFSTINRFDYGEGHTPLSFIPGPAATESRCAPTIITCNQIF
jgi:hypothetical protein